MGLEHCADKPIDLDSRLEFIGPVADCWRDCRPLICISVFLDQAGLLHGGVCDRGMFEQVLATIATVPAIALGDRARSD